MILESKYSIGDVVFHPFVMDVAGEVDCPDCLGKGVWPVTSPAGEQHEASCPRCAGSYYFRRGKLKTPGCEASVRRLTIGRVAASSHPRFSGDHDSCQYMANETGVGSGSVYGESRLFSTEAEAMEEAERMAAARRGQIDAQPHVIRDRALYVLPTKAAELKEIENRYWSMRWALEELQRKIIELPETDWELSLPYGERATPKQLKDVSFLLMPEDHEARQT